jgi:hypothetical protein
MGMPVDLDNVSVAPHGQEETGPDARSVETPDEAQDL